METTALVLAYVGVALMVGLAGIASSIGTSIAAVWHRSAPWKKNGGAFGSYMILSGAPPAGSLRFRLLFSGAEGPDGSDAAGRRHSVPVCWSAW